MSEVAIVGAGGQAREVFEIFEARGEADRVIGFFEEGRSETGRLLDLPVAPLTQIPAGCPVVVAIGAVERQRLALHLKRAGHGLASLVHPDAYVSPRCHVGEGVIIQRDASLMTASRVGAGVIVNVGVLLHHDSRIGAFSTLCPGAAIAGRVRVGARCWIGIGAVVRDGVAIGDDATVGAGAVVVADVEAGTTVVGNPATERR